MEGHRGRRGDAAASQDRSETGAIRVLVADDHPTIIEGLVSALGRHSLSVVGHAGDAEEVVAKFGETKADVLVMDVRFGEGATGLDVARDVLHAFPKARVVFYSQFDEDEFIRDAYRMGGAAFITKDVESNVLVDVIEQVYRDPAKPYFLPEIAERLALLGLRGDASPQSKLSRRDLEVFRMMAEGRTNAEIAEHMNLSTKTISNISQNVKELLGVQRQADITRLALKYMLISP
jgi:two-component system, NarL family, invasion response regulator UvrY